MTNTKQHHDILGRPIEVGDLVATASSNNLHIAVVDKINPKMIRIKRPNRSWTQLKYPQDLIKIEGPEATAYLLKL